ncbi:MAG: CotH kinase family protein [Candidatus Taylorbacteria bacterium]
MKKRYIVFSSVALLVATGFVAPSFSYAQTPLYPIRNLTLDTQGKTLSLDEFAPNRDGKLVEYTSLGIKIKDWKIKYEKKGHMRGVCDPPMLNLSFDKFNSQGVPKELFTGVSTYPGSAQLQYQKFRMIPECDAGNDYYLGGGDYGFSGKLNVNLREYIIHKIFRKYGVPTADIIGFANVTFITPDSGYNGRTYRYMIIQRPAELDDQIPFTTEFNMNPMLYESEGSNGWYASSFDRLISALVTNNTTQVSTTVYFDRDSTLKFMLFTDFLAVYDMGALHNEEWGVDKTTDKTKVIPHGFDLSLGCYSMDSDPSSSETERLLDDLPASTQPSYRQAYYQIARNIFLQPSSLNDMFAMIDDFPYLNVNKEILREYLRIKFYQYAKYANSSDFAQKMGQTFVPVNITLPFASDSEYATHLSSFKGACGRVPIPLTGVTVSVASSSLSATEATFTVDVTTTESALELFKSRYSSSFAVSLVGTILVQSGTNNNQDLGIQYVPLYGVEDFAGPYYIIPPNTTARFVISGSFNEENLLRDTYFAKLLTFRPNNDIEQFVINDAKTNSLHMGVLDPIVVTLPQKGDTVLAGSTTTISWTGTPGRATGISISGTDGQNWPISNPEVWDQTYIGNRFVWTAGRVYSYNQVIGGWTFTMLNSGQYKISIRDVNSGITGETGYFNLVDSPDTVLPSAGIVGASTISLLYDPSDGGEAGLTTRFKVSISAGSRDQLISKRDAFSSYAVSVDGQNYMGGVETYSSVGTTDQGDFYLIPAGTTAEFTVTVVFEPKKMFAGAYRGILTQVTLGGFQNSRVIGVLPPNTTNALIIVGEVSPYLTSVSPERSAPSNATVTIAGVRFAPAGNILTLTNQSSGVSVVQTLPSTDGGKTIQFVPNVPVGNYSIQVTHPTTGKSNRLYLTITPGVFSLTITNQGTGLGQVLCNKEVCDVLFPQNAPITLTAVPFAGSTFSGWTGACSGIGSCFLKMDAGKAVIATFTKDTPPDQNIFSVSLSISPSTITTTEAATVSWTSNKATSCAVTGLRANGATSGTKSVRFTVPTTITYTVTCEGEGGSKTASANLIVTKASSVTPNNPTTPSSPSGSSTPPPTISLSTKPEPEGVATGPTILPGESVDISWTSTNASICTGSVSGGAEAGSWAGNQATSGTLSTGPIQSQATFTLSCSGAGGTSAKSVTVAVPPVVDPPDPTKGSTDSSFVPPKSNLSFFEFLTLPFKYLLGAVSEAWR